MTKKNIITIIIAVFAVILIACVAYAFYAYYEPEETNKNTNTAATVASFDECVAAGNPVMESYPRQCRAGDQLFVEDIGDSLDKADLIRLDSPRPGDRVSSPLTVSGQARGYWFFEASFPVQITDSVGNVIAETFAQAQDEWMTEDFVPFSSVIEFNKPAGQSQGYLVLRKDNPSALPEFDDEMRIPVLFE